MNLSFLKYLAIIVAGLTVGLDGASLLLGAEFNSKLQEPDKEPQDEDDELASRFFGQVAGSVFLAPSRDHVRSLIRAQRAIEEQETDRAAELIGGFLENESNEDFLVDHGEQPGLSVSLHQRAESMLAQLPDSSLQRYQLRYGIPARQSLDSAVESADSNQLRNVARRFFFTEAGQQATVLLAHAELDRGNPLSAAALFQKVQLMGPDRDRFEPALSILLATCWVLSDQPEQARTILQTLRDNRPQAQIQFQGRTVAIFGRNDAPLPWLANLIGASPLKRNRQVNRWLMEGGNPQRNAEVEGGFPFAEPLWTVETTVDPQKLELISSIENQFQASPDASLIPSVGALALQDTVIMRNESQAIGVSLQTGKRRWSFPSQARDRPQSAGSPFNNRSPFQSRRQNATPGLWNDTLHGQSSSDGSSIFLIPNETLSTPSVTTGNRNVVSYSNYLNSISLDAQGKLNWRVGGLESEAEPKLAGAFFLGAPLPIGDDLFVLANLNQEVRLVVLEKETGRLQWSQQLATTTPAVRGDFSATAAPNSGMSPSYIDGVLVCPTAQEALVAIDLTSRRFMWGMQFSENSRRRRNANQWEDRRLILERDKVILASPISGKLYVFNLESGVPEENFGRSGSSVPDGTMLTCVHQDLIILAQPDQILAVSLVDRSEKWQLSLQPFGRASGRGFKSGKFYFLPTEDRFVLKIDLSQGKVVQQIESTRTLGNLISYRGLVLSHTADELACFESDTTAANRIAAAVESAGGLNRAPVEVLQQRARYMAQLERWEDTITTMDLAFRQDASSIDVSQLANLLRLMLAQRVPGAVAQCRKYFSLLTEQDQGELAIWVIESQIPPREIPNAIDQLFEWSENEFGDKLNEQPESSEPDSKRIELPQYLIDQTVNASVGEIGSSKEDTKLTGSRRKIIRFSRSSWYLSAMKRIFEIADDQQRAEIRRRVETELSNLNSADPEQIFRRFQRYPASVISTSRWLELVDRQLEAGLTLEAERSLQLALGGNPAIASVTPNAGAQVSGPALLRWAKLLKEQGRREEIARVVDGLKNDRLNLSPAAKTEECLSQLEELIELNAQTTLESSTVEFNRIKVDATETNVGYQANQLLPVVVDPLPYRAMQDLDLYYWERSNELTVVDRLGNQQHQFNLRRQPVSVTSTVMRAYGRIQVCGGLGIFHRGYDLAAIDMANLKPGSRSPVLWNRSVKFSGRRAASNVDQRFVDELDFEVISPNQLDVEYAGGLRNGICFLHDFELICVDPISGQQRWSRDVEHDGRFLLGDDDYAITIDPRSNQADVFNLLSGQRVSSVQLPEEFAGLWDSVGRHALTLGNPSHAAEVPSDAAEKSSDDRVIGLYDFVNAKFLWKRRYSTDTKATRCSGQRILVLQPTGRVEVVDQRTGELLGEFESRLSKSDLDKVRNFGATDVADRTIVVFNQIDQQSSSVSLADNVRAYRIHSSDRFFSGHLLALERESSMPIWDKPVYLVGFSILPLTPRESPVLFVHRRTQPLASRSSTLQKAQHLVGIDFQNGQLVLSEMMPDFQIYFQRPIQFLPERGEFEMDVTRFLARLTLRQEIALPPSPRVSIGTYNPTPWVNDQATPVTLDIARLKASNEELTELARQAEQELQRLREEELREQAKRGGK